MDEHLRALLQTLGYPVSWGGLGRGTGLPRIALYLVSGLDAVTADGRSGWVSGRVQVDCYGSTYTQARGLSRAVTALLSGYRGGPIWIAKLEATRGMTEEAGGETIQRVSLDFAVTYRE